MTPAKAKAEAPEGESAQEARAERARLAREAKAAAAAEVPAAEVAEEEPPAEEPEDDQAEPEGDADDDEQEPEEEPTVSGTAVIYRSVPGAPYPGHFLTMNVGDTTVTLEEGAPTEVDAHLVDALCGLESPLYTIVRA